MNWDAMTSQERWTTLQNMITFGGGFASRLGQAWMRADTGNSNALAGAFPDLIDKFQPANWEVTATVQPEQPAF